MCPRSPLCLVTPDPTLGPAWGVGVGDTGMEHMFVAGGVSRVWNRQRGNGGLGAWAGLEESGADSVDGEAKSSLEDLAGGVARSTGARCGLQAFGWGGSRRSLLFT